MDVAARVRGLVDGMRRRRILEVVEEYYAADVRIVDNAGDELIGRAALRAQEARFLEEVEVHAIVADEVLVDGDRSTIAWRYDVTPCAGSRGGMRMIVIQRWAVDRIQHEMRYQI